jgi:hypothetical protein
MRINPIAPRFSALIARKGPPEEKLLRLLDGEPEDIQTLVIDLGTRYGQIEESALIGSHFRKQPGGLKKLAQIRPYLLESFGGG